MRVLQIAVLGVCALLFAGVVVGGWPDLVFALALEDSPLAWLQASALVACATAATLRASLDRGRAALGWGAFSLALLAAALDERFMGHERLQAAAVAAGGGGLGVRGVGMIFPVVVAAIAITVAAWLRAQLDRRAWRWCRAGIACGLAALALDFAFDTASPQVLEETLEFVAESLFLVGLLTEARIQASRPR